MASSEQILFLLKIVLNHFVFLYWLDKLRWHNQEKIHVRPSPNDLHHSLEHDKFFLFFNWHFQADKTGDLDVVEFFKLEHYVAAIRREYVGNYESRGPSAVTQTQMKKVVASHGMLCFLLITREKIAAINK